MEIGVGRFCSNLVHLVTIMETYTLCQCFSSIVPVLDRNVSIPKVFMAEYVAHRGYYMAVRRYEISLRVLKNISRVSAANE